jgi:MtrB/PioB family decaheme-associated outer membrane protein
MRMRAFAATTLLLLAAGAAQAQDAPQADTEPRLELDFGFRVTGFGEDSDEARFQRYRDLRNGPLLTGVRYRNQNERWITGFDADNVGYRDQRYFADINRPGRLRVSFEWNQIPLFMSEDTATPFRQVSPGVFRLPSELQQPREARALTLASYVPFADPFDARNRRDIADFRLTYSPSTRLDLNVGFRHTMREGNQPWGASFGFSNADELLAPVDHSTTEFGAGAEWTNNRTLVRVAYDGSIFQNDVDTLVWDNPLVGIDAPTGGAAQGRMAIWPGSSLHSASVMASHALPARSRVTGSVTLGNWSQDADLIPFTTNSALPEIALDRPTAEAQANVGTANLSITSRPSNLLWLSARYRTYNFDNQTPVFHTPQTVAYDTTVQDLAHGETTPFGYDRHTFDADASITPWARGVAFRLGYTLEDVDRTFRVFDNTTENFVRASVDSTAWTWLTVRGLFEHSRRTGSGLDEEALDDIGEQVALRQFDISNRTMNRVSAIAQLMPASTWSLSANLSVGDEDRSQAVFGLRSNDNYGIGFGADFVPRDAVSVGISYQFEKFTALQRSRFSNTADRSPDPARDWTTDQDDTAHTLSASAELQNLWPRTVVRVSYDLSRARSVYVYGVGPQWSSAIPVQLPAVENRFNRATADVRYSLTRQWAAGVGYMFDDYQVDDYAFDPATLNSIAQPGFLTVRSLFRPYTANTVFARVTYLW